jgi:hypothetical protein
MESDAIRVLCGNWLQSKEDELKAIERRHTIEDEIGQLLNVDSSKDCTTNLIDGDIQISVVSKLKRKINVRLLHSLAEEHGLVEEIKTLFNWIPEFNNGAWQRADPGVTEALEKAIEVSPQRPVVVLRKFP